MTNRDIVRPTGMVPLVAAPSDGREIPGRRDFLEYRDLGVKEASRGLSSTQWSRATKGLVTETGWHRHLCDFQWVYLTEGWVDLQLEDGTARRVEAGSVVFIPGGCAHNETATSEEFELIEIFMPPDPETVDAEVPDVWRT